MRMIRQVRIRSEILNFGLERLRWVKAKRSKFQFGIFLLRTEPKGMVSILIVMDLQELGEYGGHDMRLWITLRTLSFVLTALKMLAPWHAEDGGGRAFLQ